MSEKTEVFEILDSSKLVKGFIRDTELMMANGIKKKVQDLIPGDEIMYYNSYHENKTCKINSTKSGKGQMIKVTPEKGRGDIYFVGKDNKLVFTAEDETVLDYAMTFGNDLISLEKYDYFLRMSYGDYLELPDIIKSELKSVRCCVNFIHDSETLESPLYQKSIHPFIMGYWLGSKNKKILTIYNVKDGMMFEEYGNDYFERKIEDKMVKYCVTDKFNKEIIFYGLSDVENKNKYFVPDAYLVADDYKDREDLLNGFFSVTHKELPKLVDPNYYYAQNYYLDDYPFLNDITFLLRSLGYDVVEDKYEGVLNYYPYVTFKIMSDVNIFEGRNYDSSKSRYVDYPGTYKCKLELDPEKTDAEFFGFELEINDEDKCDPIILLGDFTASGY